MPEHTVGDVTLYCETSGSGFPLLLICGTGLPMAIWGFHAGWLSELRTVVAFDNRDTGRSSSVDVEYTPADLAGDAAGLLDALGLEQADVLGYSLGGAVAQELALAAPERVRSLILCSTWATTDHWLKVRFAAWERVAAAVDGDTITELGALDMYTHRFFENPAALDLLRAAAAAGAAEAPDRGVDGFLRQWRADQAHDARDRVRAIACPTLVVVGAEDVLVPARYSRELAELIPGARLQMIDDAAHGALIERPDAFRAAIEPFLREF